MWPKLTQLLTRISKTKKPSLEDLGMVRDNISSFLSRPKGSDLTELLEIQNQITSYLSYLEERNRPLNFISRHWEELQELQDFLVSQIEKQLYQLRNSNVSTELMIYPLEFALKAVRSSFLSKLLDLRNQDNETITDPQCKQLTERLTTSTLLKLEEILPDEKWEIRNTPPKHV